LGGEMEKFRVILPHDDYDVVEANTFDVSDNETLRFYKDRECIAAYSNKYWLRVNKETKK
jgi:hypothetical protein